MFSYVVTCASNERFVDAGFGSQQSGTVTALWNDSGRGAVQDNFVKAFLKGRRTKTDVAFPCHHERTAVKHQFVLSAHHVDVDNRNLDFRNSLANLHFAIFLTCQFVGRPVDHYDAFRAGGSARCHRSRAPDVFANIESDSHTIDREDRGLLATGEVSLLIEYAVIGQQPFAIVGKNLTIGINSAGVVDVLVGVFGMTKEYGYP